MRTYTPRPGDVARKWYVIDANDVVLGKLATQAAALLRGKHKTTFAPHMDVGDFVVVINADKVALSGAKRRDKLDYRHSGFPGGLSSKSYGDVLEENPRRLVEKAVKGMLPHNKLGRAQLKKLKVYSGSAHPHAAQEPEVFEITQIAQ
ncbi:50S ribosomal protein L13 [Candidatus Nanopelagicales bacterium]|nr:50S ribosomal protein L13 [Candidatus Nanopelagicales bacterium]